MKDHKKARLLDFYELQIKNQQLSITSQMVADSFKKKLQFKGLKSETNTMLFKGNDSAVTIKRG